MPSLSPPLQFSSPPSSLPTLAGGLLLPCGLGLQGGPPGLHHCGGPHRGLAEGAAAAADGEQPRCQRGGAGYQEASAGAADADQTAVLQGEEGKEEGKLEVGRDGRREGGVEGE